MPRCPACDGEGLIAIERARDYVTGMSGEDAQDAGSPGGTGQRVADPARETVPPQFEGRNLYVHNPTVTLMRTTPEECAELGAQIGRKLSAAQGPTAVFVPLRGVSMIAVAGQPFHDDAADEALFSALRASLDDSIELNERDTDINDPELAVEMADRLHALIEAAR